FLDVEALLREIRDGLRQQGEQLRSRWQLEGRTGVCGAFRLRYVLVREKGVLEGVAAAASPDPAAGFRFGLDMWEAEPVVAVRGELPEAALAEGSEFRRLIDRLDARQTAVTFWVYPDSFDLYRRLRDYCVRRDILVAGRPLPLSVPMASSRHGTVSRGQ